MELQTANTAPSKGTAWRIWDLHIHTPASIVQKYGGDTDEAWARFLDELENLPSDMSVIGINDYWFLDGYKRVLKARESGRLRNITTIFPVVEMRFDQFGGTEGNLSRVNGHVVFDPDLTPELIEAQFMHALQPKMKLSPGHSNLTWQGVITRESLEELGQKIKESVPEEHLQNYGSDLQEGFNNLNVSLDDVQEILSRSYFKGKALIGVGKTEWADIKWNDQSIGAKKNVINSADFIFTAFQDSSRWKKDVETLRASNVNDRLLDCSDAHYFSDSDQHIKLGACQTWMNTSPTFAGLAYALEEFDRRVFIGLEPPSLARVRKNPEQFISKVQIRSESSDHKLFDYEIPMNSGFVAVVGNKGQGKSALLDCIALAGNSSRNREFAFLNKTRFLSPTGLKAAKQYSAEVEWASGGSRKVQLHEDHDSSAPVYIEYLPQAFVERVCSTDPASGDSEEFENELRAILFTHISEEDRSGERTFDALLAQKTRASLAEIERLRDELRTVINDYGLLASFRAENQLEEVNGKISLKETEISDAKEALRLEKESLAEVDSASRDDGELVALRERAVAIDTARADLLSKQTENERRQALSKQALSTMEALSLKAEALRVEAMELNVEAATVLPQDESPFIAVTIETHRYEKWKSSTDAELATLKGAHEGLLADLASQDDARQKNMEALAAADSARERARQRVIQSEERVANLEGTEDDEESHLGLCALRERVTAAPAQMDELRKRIIDCSGRIHAALSGQLDTVTSLYSPASRFIEQSEVVSNAGLEFDAELRMLPVWHNVATSLDARRNGDFPEWLSQLPHRLEDTSWDELAAQLLEALVRLEHERADPSADYRDPASALRTTTTLVEFLMSVFSLSWLEVRFGLTGDGLPLSQLSPGQRGLVLALFYLVVDRRTTPLLLDQPEENLDNETIASKLVPAIHEAAGRRQTIVVTHNANLAVVGDADQIIHCQFQDNKFTIDSGSIAEIDVARFALNVLEGTKPAFDNRRQKYEAFPDLNL